MWPRTNTLSLPRVINFKFPLQPRQKYYIAQQEELEKLIISPILTTSFIHFLFKGWEDVLFHLESERVHPWKRTQIRPQSQHLSRSQVSLSEILQKKETGKTVTPRHAGQWCTALQPRSQGRLTSLGLGWYWSSCLAETNTSSLQFIVMPSIVPYNFKSIVEYMHLTQALAKRTANSTGQTKNLTCTGKYSTMPRSIKGCFTMQTSCERNEH